MEKLSRARSLAVVVGALALTTLVTSLAPASLEAFFFDLRTQMSYPLPKNPEVVIVQIDQESLEELSDFSPLSLDHHVKLLKNLANFHPKAIGYLVNMNLVQQGHPEQFTEERTTQFIEAVNTLEKNGTPFVFGTPFDVSGEILPPHPLSQLHHAIALIHRDGNIFSKDQVTRRALISLQGKPTFHLALAQEAGILPKGYRPHGFYATSQGGEYFLFRYQSQPSMQDNVFQRIPFSDISQNKVSEEQLRNKILLVDTLIEKNPGDFSKDPSSGDQYLAPNALIHASILTSLIKNDGIELSHSWLTWTISFLLTLSFLWAILTLRPLLGLAYTFLATVLYFILAFGIFRKFHDGNGLWLPLGEPLLCLVLSHYVIIPYRLVKEYKRRWEAQKKNAVLMQVEELKSNFLSLITHDLKTPIARIQGLCGALIHSNEFQLTAESRKALAHISRSTEELNHFITSILELTRIESNNVRLNLQSKDVNQVIERIVDRLRVQAQFRNICLQLQLEPLFPIQIDPDLIAKVITNVLDNAIKYSPENSIINLRTQDYGEYIEIQIEDHGPGFTKDQLDHAFTKFNRSRPKDNLNVSGSGLGLYLAKYFVDAHHGSIAIQSEEGKGTALIIRLSTNLRSDGTHPGLTLDTTKEQLKRSPIDV